MVKKATRLKERNDRQPRRSSLHGVDAKTEGEAKQYGRAANNKPRTEPEIFIYERQLQVAIPKPFGKESRNKEEKEPTKDPKTERDISGSANE